MPPTDRLTVAVTGPTGTFGSGLLGLLEAEERVERVIGLARRPFDAAARGWYKLDYRQGDVRDPEALREAFAGADVVVHLAFAIAGAAPREELEAINVQGTLAVAHAAAAAGVERFVYASSVAAYGFHPDNPVGMAEDWPTRPADHLFYAQQKAQLDERLRGDEAFAQMDLLLLRPPVVVGPNAVGAKLELPGWLAPLGRALGGGGGVPRSPLPIPVPVADLAFQLIHEDDVGQALLLCVLGAGPPGAYNIAGEGTISPADVARELGFAPVTVVPGGLVQRASRAIAALPGLPPAVGWAEALAHPAIMDTTRAHDELGFRPAYSALEALRTMF